MKYKKLKTRGVGVITLALSGALICGQTALAWGPERPTYTNEKPADHAVFNSITNNAAVGDERDFVRIEEKNSGRPYSSEIILEAGKQYEVYIYYHNDASATYNAEKYNYVGVAQNVRLSSSFPLSLEKNERAAVIGRITSTNTQPQEVWDEAYVTAKEAMTLHYVTGSAKISNNGKVSGSVLSKNLFSETGTFIGTNTLNGVILGCEQYSGQVVYTIQTEAVETTTPDDPTVDPEPDPAPDPDPEPEPDPDPTPEPEPKPVVPEELPTTGPAEVILAVIVVVAVAAGGVYWYKSSKEVKKVTKRAKGKKK